MSKATHRTQILEDGSRRIEKYVGTDPRLLDSDDPSKWQPVLDMPAGAVWSGFVRASADIEVAPIPGGVLLSIGSVRHGIPLDQIEAALDAIKDAVKAARNL